MTKEYKTWAANKGKKMTAKLCGLSRQQTVKLKVCPTVLCVTDEQALIKENRMLYTYDTDDDLVQKVPHGMDYFFPLQIL